MIRDALITDEEQINKLGLLLNRDYDKLFDLKTILNEEYSRFYVYVIDSKVVGFIHATVLYEIIDIVNIVVDPQYRRQKIASNLFDTLLTRAPSNIESITLEVEKGNEGAIKFYQDFGFEIVNIRKEYYRGNDGYLMERKID